TTHRQMIPLSCGAVAIDTPGMRELGMWDAEGGVRAAFDDVEALALTCRFSDCTHQGEPGCAVRAAIQRGELTDARLKNHNRLLREAQRDANRAAFAREKTARNKAIAAASRKRK
ncbi:MAG: ribosome small subunit-dependent GTPase, partial [Clostridiales bacterium]|nr:ribosome small subunit-dependent GTPase [Clostridiales bacterium]